MTDKSKRLKANDVFAESHNPFVPRTSSFSEAFPSIKSIRVEIEEFDYGDFVGSSIYTQGNLSQFINCKNPSCYNGGFNVGELIHSMEYEKQTEREFEAECQGYEGSPKGKRRTGSCEHTFNVKIKISYLESTN